MRYLGHLPASDPVYGYLHDRLFPRKFGFRPRRGFRVFALAPNVYIYADRRHDRRVLGKYFTHPHAARAEYETLKRLEAAGFCHGRHRVVRPLGKNFEFANVIFEDFVDGEPMYRIWERFAATGDSSGLMHSLSDLAYFLSRLHNHTATSARVDFYAEFPYFDKIIARLWRRGRIRQEQIDTLYAARGRWAEDPLMHSDNTVRLHGDATPANFILTSEHHLIAVDLERSRYADRVYDLGIVAAELKHCAMLHLGHGGHAEPRIGHFLWEYSRHFPDHHDAFHAITQRLPFYMAIGLLRIARNSYLDHGYARALVHEAVQCMRK